MLTRLLSIITLLLLTLPAFCEEQDADDTFEQFRCDIMSIQLPRSEYSTTYFFENYAVEFKSANQKEIVAFYDLDKHTFTRVAPTVTLTLEECEEWKKQATKVYLSQVDEERRPEWARYYKRTLHPEYKVSKEKTGLTIKGEIRRFQIEGQLELSDKQIERFLAFHELRAYHRRMTQRMIPPAPMLEVNKALKKHGFVPELIQVTVKHGEGNRSQERTAFRIYKASDQEISQARKTMLAVPPEED